MGKNSTNPPDLPPRSTSSFSRKRRLFCTNGYYLEISYNGTVKGTMNEHSPLVLMEIVPAGINLVRIRGVKTGLYLGIREGNVYTSKTQTDEGIFLAKLSKQFYDNYISNRYLGNNLTLGVTMTGDVGVISDVKDTSKYETHFITKIATT